MRLLTGITNDIQRLRNTGVFYIGVSSWLTRLVALAQRILLARILGPENIGHIAIVTSALNIIRLPAGVGTFTVVNKLVAENTGNVSAQKLVIGTSLLVNTGTSIVVGLAAWIILSSTNWINDIVANQFLRLLLLLLPVMIFSEVLRNALIGQKRMKATAGIDIALSLIAIIVVVPMAYLWSVNGWLANQIIIIIAGFCAFIWLLKPILSLKWDRKIANKVAAIGGFAFLGQLVGMLIIQFDTFAVDGILNDSAKTGIYNTASLIAQQMIVIPGSIFTVLFPYVAQNINNLPKLKEKHKELFKKTCLMAIVISAFSWLLSPWIFKLFGSQFIPAVYVFRILMIGFIARSIYVLDNTFLDALGRTDLTFISGLISAIVTILLNITFIPKWGINGAAWATTISVFISFFIRQFAVRYFIFYKKAIY